MRRLMRGFGSSARRGRHLVLAAVVLAVATGAAWIFTPEPGFRRVSRIDDYPATAEAFGWRRDGTGHFPAADPPIEWGPAKNVSWRTPMPAHGNASPVICGDRIFVTAEPTTLLCVDKDTGAILWQRENGYEVTVSGKGRRRRMLEATRETSRLAAECNDTMFLQHAAHKRARSSPEDAALRERVRDLDRKLKQLRKQYGEMQKGRLPRVHTVTGYASPTPVTNGRYVYAVFGTVVVVCYDLDGNLIWARRLDDPPHHWGTSASPLLVGRILAVHVNDLYGLCAATGELLWKAKTPWGWGSPVHFKCGEADYILTSQGNVVRPENGEILPVSFGALEYNGPVVEADRVYCIEGVSRAFQLECDGDLVAHRLWKSSIPDERYYSGPLVTQGFVYAITRDRRLSVLDAASGARLSVRKLELGGRTAFPSITRAGSYIFISGEAGLTIVLDAGQAYSEVARNDLGEFSRSCPVFEGSRMYVRGLENLYCIGK